MENEEEKKVDTQTTGETEKSNVNGNSSDKGTTNEGTEKEQSKNDGEQTKNEEDISKAFGNSVEENKNEADKSKKTNSVAKTNEDGSITFKNQAELDGFIDRMYKKGINAKKNSTEQATDTKVTENIETNTEENNTTPQENSVLNTESLRAEVALEMIDADINAKKARKASRLVDLNKVVTNGVLDKAKLKTEIEEIVAEWPELKAQAVIEEKKGFMFGGSQGDMSSNSEDTEISKIFGNLKED